MPTRSFAITADDQPISLKGGGVGEIAVTVSNSTGRPVRGLAKVVPLGSTKQEWLAVAGEVERSFSANEAHQYVVRMTIPPGTPAGKYSCRMNMMSVQNPDDDFTEGPAVSFEVARASEPAVQKKAQSKWLFWVILAVLAGGGAAAVVVLMWPSKGEAPNLIGMNESALEAKFAGSELHFEKDGERFESGKAAGVIVAQKPEEGTPVKNGDTIRYVTAIGSVKVPAGIQGASMTSAVQRLVSSGLQIGEVVKASTSEKAQWEKVKSINPASNTEVEPGTKVKLEVWAEPARDLSVLKAQVFEMQKSQNLKMFRVQPKDK